MFNSLFFDRIVFSAHAESLRVHFVSLFYRFRFKNTCLLLPLFNCLL